MGISTWITSSVVTIMTATAFATSPSTDANLRQPLEHHVPVRLNAIDATGPNDVWAVGQTNSYFDLGGLVSHWTGTGWAGHSLGAGGRSTSTDEVVSVVNPVDVWVAGNYGDADGGPGRFIARRSRDGWRYVLFNEETDGRTWRGISAVAGAAFALGGYGRAQSLVWSDVGGLRHRTPVPGVMQAISMDSADDGWMVGGDSSDHFDGSTWSPVPIDDSSARLVSVSATSSDAWAVGRQPSGKLVEHEVDGAWNAVTLPAGMQPGSLVSVSASSSDDVWALGLNGTGATVALHWDGSSWQQTLLDSTGLTAMVPTGIAAAAGAVWAVGNSAGRPFREHWAGSSWRQT